MVILHAIGNTSLVQLRKVVPPKCADIFVKLEWENPTGSMKDRMAQAVISCAEEDGRLRRVLRLDDAVPIGLQASPDGRSIAFGVFTWASNACLLEWRQTSAVPD